MRFPLLSVSARLLLSFVGAVAFVVAASAVAIYSFNRLNSAMDNVAYIHLPTMIKAFQLAQQAEGTVASAPALVASSAQSQRQTAYFRVQDQISRLEELIVDLAHLGHIPRESLLVIEREKDNLKNTFDKLNKAVEARIRFNIYRAELLSDLVILRSSVWEAFNDIDQELGQRLIDTRSSKTAKTLSAMHTLHVQLDLAVDSLVASSESPHRFSVEHLRLTHSQALKHSSALLAVAPPGYIDRLTPLFERIKAHTDGPDDSFKARLSELEAIESISGLLSRYSHISSRLVFAVTELIFAAQADIDKARAESLSISENQSTVLVGLTVTCVIGVVLVVFYVTRSVIHRLEGLQHNMEAGAAGETVLVETTGDDEIGRMARALSAFITARDKAEHDLRLARDEAENANLAKTKFLASASHDLRQPLQALNLFVTALADKELPEDTRKIVTRVEDSVEALSSLLDSLLDISKLDAGVVAVNRSAFPLAMLLNRLTAEFEPIAAEKELTLRTYLRNVTVFTDASLLERIVRNLLSNALRYTEMGGIFIGVRRRGDYAAIEVWDTGPGIPKDKIEDIFHEFRQLDNPNRNRSKGLGLGLAIVRRTAQLLSHTIEVRSTPGRGSVFRVLVPLADHTFLQAPQEVEPMTLPAVVATLTILVIDDEAPIRDGMRMVLNGYCRYVVAAESAEQAIRKLERDGLTPDLVICDYRLEKGVKGDAAIDLIRSHFNRPVPAILITGEIGPEELIQTKASGLPILHKPISAELLWRTIGAAFSDDIPDET